MDAFNQEGRIQKWIEHFNNLFRNPPKVTYKPIKNIHDQIGIKQGSLEENST